MRFFLAGRGGGGGPEELGVANGCVGVLLNSSPMRKKDDDDESAAMILVLVCVAKGTDEKSKSENK